MCKARNVKAEATGFRHVNRQLWLEPKPVRIPGVAGKGAGKAVITPGLQLP